MRRRTGGFTMVELVMVIIMLGILAVFVMPRMDTSAYRALQFHDQTVAALRYAQKTATSHRRLVCVTFDPSASTVTLTMALANPAASCGASLMLPGGTSNLVTSSDTTNAIFSPVPASLYFQPDGRGTEDGAGLTIYSARPAINGASTITVVGATGYVQ